MSPWIYSTSKTLCSRIEIYILIENFSDYEDSWYNILFASKDEQFIKNEMTRLQSRETCLCNLEKAIETFKEENCINYNDFIKTLDLKKRKEYTSTSWEDLTTEQKKKRMELIRENIEIERYNAEIKNNICKLMANTTKLHTLTQPLMISLM
jgi:hypothetical protein